MVDRTGKVSGSRDGSSAMLVGAVSRKSSVTLPSAATVTETGNFVMLGAGDWALAVAD